jgi:hypothetical protein
VTVTCRVLKLCRQQYYRWLAKPVTDAELEWAYRANALFDAHRDDPAFGYRYCLDEAHDAGERMCPRTAWSICSANAWWSVFSKKRTGRPRPGPPVHEDLLAFEDDKGRTRHDFTAVTSLDQVWFTDITEHKSGRREVVPVRDQGRLLGSDRWLLD